MRLIKLNKNKYAMISDCDFDIINEYEWYYEKNSTQEYAKMKTSKKTIRMHNLILPKLDRFVVDHIDKNGLNNQRENLRYLNKSMNGLNSHRSKGFYFDKKKNKFISNIRVNGINYYIGSFDDAESANKAYIKFKDHVFYKGAV